MKKKKLENVPYVKPAPGGKKYFTANAQEVEFAGQKNVVFDIYRNQKKKWKAPLWRVCINENEYGVYNVESGVWQQMYVTSLDIRDKDGVHSVSDNSVHIDADSGKRIQAWTGYTGITGVKIFQREINNRERDKRTDRKEERLRQRIADTPDIPDRFYTWCEETLYPSSYMFYKRKGRYADFHCGNCGQEFCHAIKAGQSYESQMAEHIVEVPVEREVTICGYCGASAIYMPWGRRKGGIEEEKACYIIQRFRETGVVIRNIIIRRNQSVTGTQVYEDIEIVRVYIEDGKKVEKDYHVADSWTGETLWQAGNLPGLNSITTKAGPLYPGFVVEIPGTILQYSAIEHYQKRTLSKQWEKYALAYWRHPVLEMLVKMELYDIAINIVNGIYPKYLNEFAATAADILQIDKCKVKLLCHWYGRDDWWTLLRYEHRQHINIPEKLEYAIIQLGLRVEDYENVFQVMSPEKTLNRICHYVGVSPEELAGGLDGYCYNAVREIRDIAQTYMDYIGMRIARGYDMSNTVYQKPRDLHAAHNQMVEECDKFAMDKRIREVEKKYSAIRKNYKNIKDFYTFSSDGMCIRPAKSAKEIVLEGRKQRHCVGGDTYLCRYADGSSYILLLRDENKPAVPYVTVEIRGTTVVQWYGKANTRPDEKRNREWLDAYVKHLEEALQDGGMKAEGKQTAVLLPAI